MLALIGPLVTIAVIDQYRYPNTGPGPLGNRLEKRRSPCRDEIDQQQKGGLGRLDGRQHGLER